MKRQKKSSPQEHALVSDGGRGDGSARGHAQSRDGAQGDRRSWSRGGRSNSSSKKSEDDGKAALDSADDKKSGKIKGKKCFTCRHRGHISAQCTVERCKRCGGVGHSKDQCPSSQEFEESVLAMVLDETVELPGMGERFSHGGVSAGDLYGGRL